MDARPLSDLSQRVEERTLSAELAANGHRSKQILAERERPVSGLPPPAAALPVRRPCHPRPPRRLLLLLCRQRREWEADYFAAEARAARAAVPTDDAATQIAKLGLTGREVARLLGCGIGPAQKLPTPGERVGREIVERALELRRGAIKP